MTILEKIQAFVKNRKNPVIVFLGPTASGKTELSLKIAKEINAEIISADSRQIYTKMDISTDAISMKARKGIVHHFINIKEPDEVLTLAEYKKMAMDKIEEIFSRGKIPIITGGTGLYINSIMEEYEIPVAEPNLKLREKYTKMAEKYGVEHVHKKLQTKDPLTAKKIHPHNLRYVIRALEICESFGKKRDKKKKTKKHSFFCVGISVSREILYERIEKRVDKQIKRGLIEEVKKLIEEGYKENLPSMSSLGVKEIIPFLKGVMSKEDCVELLKRNTRRYAKRQITWFKRTKNVKWIKPQEAENI